METLDDPHGTNVSESDEIAIAEFQASGETTHQLDWLATFARRCSSAACVAVLIALPVAMAAVSGENLLARIPLLQNLGYLLLANNSAVLAVDATGLTIQSGQTPVSSLEPFEHAVLNQLANLHRTYARWAGAHKDVSGSLTLKLRIDASGQVAAMDPLAARLSDSDFIRVVLSEIGRWRFPAGHPAPVEITIPLLFVPKGMEPSTVVQWERKNRLAAEENRSALSLRIPRNTPMTLTPDSVLLATAAAENRQREAGRDTATAAKPEIDRRENFTAFRITHAVSLRDQPRYSARRIQEIDSETAISVIQQDGDWLKIKVTSVGAVGFVRKEFIAPADAGLRSTETEAIVER